MNTDHKKTKIKKYRERTGLSTGKFAQSIGITRVTLYRIEQGTPPTLRVLGKIRRGLSELNKAYLTFSDVIEVEWVEEGLYSESTKNKTAVTTGAPVIK